MKISVNDKSKMLSAEAFQRVKLRLHASFARFGDSVSSVDLTIADVNGPKGGIDKECRVVVTLRKLSNVVVSANDESITRAINGAVDRSARTVRRALSRRLARGGSPATGLKS